MKIYRALIQTKGDIQVVYVATNPPHTVIDEYAIDFLFNNKQIFFYFYDEQEMEDFMDEGSGRDWELIDCKYLTEKLSIEFEVFSKN
jgi:hypothetical protein